MGYGYIHRGPTVTQRQGIEVYRVQAFREKPTRDCAERYLASGAPVDERHFIRAADEAQLSHYRGMLSSPQFTSFTLEQQDEEWPAEDSGDHSNRDLGGSEECSCERIA